MVNAPFKSVFTTPSAVGRGPFHCTASIKLELHHGLLRYRGVAGCGRQTSNTLEFCSLSTPKRRRDRLDRQFCSALLFEFWIIGPEAESHQAIRLTVVPTERFGLSPIRWHNLSQRRNPGRPFPRAAARCLETNKRGVM
jgi:hypothetical protein